MKPLLMSLLLGLALSLAAAEPKVPLVQPGKLVAHPDLKEPLGTGWTIKHGTWEVKAGELTIAEVPADKHAAVLWHEVGLPSAIVQCEFQFGGGRTFILGCDATNKHVGRLVITAKSAKLVEDSSEIKGKQPGQTLAEAALNLTPGQWYVARFEWQGDRMAASVDGHPLLGQHATLAQVKARWWLAVSGAKVHVRNLQVWEGK